MSKRLWVRYSSALLLAVQALTLARPALAIEETPRFHFSDTSVGSAALSDSLTQQPPGKRRSLPVGAGGAYATSVGIDVPPGRLGMAPKLALSYTSTAHRKDSSVGTGWSFGMPRISRSTRLGTPKMVRTVGDYGYDPHGAFDTPSGEVQPTAHGPAVAGMLFAPKRETSPVRYEYLDDVPGGRWVEHFPDGHKRYYGADPFSSAHARIVTEMGAFSWLLVREEDAFGNDVAYMYHHTEDEARPVTTDASRVPVLRRATWGGNRIRGLAPAFAVDVEIGAQEGSHSALEGNTLLTSRVERIRVGTAAGAPYHAYELGYTPSPDSGRLLLTKVTRTAPGEAPTERTFTYSTSSGRLSFSSAMDLPVPLRDEFVERRAFGERHPYDPEWNDIDRAFGQHGIGSGYQFASASGQNRTDAVYLPAGLGSPQSLVSGAKSFVTSGDGPARTFAFTGSSLSRDTLIKSLSDMDGDGDLDGVSFPLAFKVADLNGPPDLLRDFSPIDKCLDTEFWSSCAGAEPYRPSRSNYGDRSCRGVVSGCLTPHFNQPQASSFGKQLLHVVRNDVRSGAPIRTTQVLSGWPSTAYQQVHVIRDQVNPGPIGSSPVSFTGKTLRDFQAPIVDINGDGRPDVVLLKQRVRVNPVAESFGNTFKERLRNAAIRRGLQPDDLLRFLMHFAGTRSYREWDERKARPELVNLADRVGATPSTSDSLWTSVVYEDLLEPLFREMSELDDETYVETSQAFVDLYGNACSAKNPTFPPEKHMSIRGAPSPFVPGGELSPGGPMGPLGGGGPLPGNPVDGWVPNRFGADPRDWCGTMWGPRTMQDYLREMLVERFDANGGVLPWSEDARTAPKEVFKFVPRVYLSDDSPERKYFRESEPEGRPGHFEKSLLGLFNGGYLNECSGPACTYASYRNFNVIPIDVNGDGLVDIVRARPPVVDADERKTCVGGHTVEINRGYVWQNQQYFGASLAFEATTPHDALALLKNRDGRCTDMLDGGGGTIPVAAMVPVDINSDGRVDWVAAFERRDYFGGNASVFVQKIFLNTGRGYRAAPELSLPSDLALSVYMSPGVLVGDPEKLPDGPPLWPDAGRIVDVDGDGLVDIVQMGYCRTVGIPPNVVEQCPAKGRWRKNLGTMPDLLIGEGASTGAETRVSYSLGDDPRYVTGPGTQGRIVATITHTAQPSPATPGLPAPAKSVAILHYSNFVRDVESPDAIGFETVSATTDSYVGGDFDASFTTTSTFDVRERVTGVDGTPLPDRYPLRGMEVRSESTDGSSTVTTTTFASARARGASTVIESNGSRTRTCVGGECRETEERVLSRDAEGFVTEQVSGPSDGANVVPSRTTTRSLIAYEHRTDGRWQLGLPTRVETRGVTEQSGVEHIDASLSVRERTFGARGEVATETTPATSASGCVDPGASTTSYTVDDFGLVVGEQSPSGLHVSRTFDAHHLYATTTSSTVTRYVGGEARGTTTLTSHSESDLRTGAQTAYTDPNGHTWRNRFDSRGRAIEQDAPGGQRIRTFTYSDVWPASATTRTVTGSGANDYTLQIRYFDGDGQVLSVVEGRGTAEVPWVRKDFARYDGFGRRIETYEPKFLGAASLATYDANDRRTSTAYDGFDRVTRVVRANGALTTFAYTASTTLETNPRGMRTLREVDDDGQVVRVQRADAAGNVVSEHRLFRDGLGQIVRVVDGDGLERHLDRDEAGRLVRYDLPHAPGAAIGATLICHDVAGRPTRVESPGGRVVQALRDEAGRTVSLSGTDAGGRTVSRTTDYDDGTFGKNALGRVSRTHDAAGERTYTYDAYSRPATVEQRPSAEIAAGFGNVASVYTTTFEYAPLGGLRSFRLAGLPKPIEVRYEADAAGRTKRLTSGGRMLVDGVVRDAEDRIVGAAFGNGATLSRAYDAGTGNLLASRHAAADGTTIEGLAYGYDAVDNVVLESRTQGNELVSQKSHTFDALDRLVGTELSIRGVSTNQTYAYSPGGNLVGARGLAYGYDLPQHAQAVTRLEQVGVAARALTYGPDGEVTTDDLTDLVTGELTHRALDTDPLGCLSQVTDGTRTTSLYCDGSGATVARRTTDEATQGVEAVIDLGGVGELRPHEGVFLMRVPLAKTTTAEEVYSLTTGDLDTTRSGYVVTDVRGSVLSRLEYAGPGRVTTHETEYDAWGKAVELSSKPRPTHAYTSREPDPGTGFYHYGPRTYDPSLRRWLSPDPLIGMAPERQALWGEQLNLYSYASNNPARWTDLSGLEGPTVMEKLASLGHFAGAAVVGFVHGLSPVPVPDPPIANERGTAHEREHVVGYATGQVGGGFLLGQAGAGIAGGGGAGEVLSGGTATMVAVPVMAVGMTMAVAGSISVSKGLVTLYNEARNHGRGGSASGEAAPQAAPEPAPAASAAQSPTPKGAGRTGGQERLRQIAEDPNTSSSDRGWIKQEQNAVNRGQRPNIRNPPGKELAHTRGREAAKGYDHLESPSNLQNKDLHKTQHKIDKGGRLNKERP